MEGKGNPAPPEVLVERDRVVSRFGDSELVITKDGITIQARCKNRPAPSSGGDWSKQ